MVARQKIRPEILFLHIGWAREYRGALDDLPQGKFGYIEDGNVDMGETLNFQDHQGRCFGYAPLQVIDLRRLGAPQDSDHLDGILVIWTATNPDGSGRYVVGWYKNARIYSERQKRGPDEGTPGIVAEAAAADSHLVPMDERTFFVPSMTRGWPGLASAFYASETLSPADVDRLLAYVGGKPSTGFYSGPKRKPPVNGGGWPRQDPGERAKIEKAASATVQAHFEAQGWDVERVEEENLGWDLNVTCGGRLLIVEVKGRSGEGSVELTANEYRAMSDEKLRMSYRLAIVFDALSGYPRLTIFEYAPGGKVWVSDGGDTLSLRPMTSAIASF